MTDPENAATASADTDQASNVKPVFGAGFNSGGGFAAFSGASAEAPKPEEGAVAGEAGEGEEECKAEFTPLVQLEEVEKTTGEENEELLLELKCKMYRFDKDSSEWKERGIGQAKFLKSKATKKIRFLMRQDKTLKIRSNHIIVPGTKISSHGGNDKAWVWSAMDFSDGEQKLELLAIRFGTPEKANEFKAEYEKSMEHNAPLLDSDAPVASPEVAKKTDPELDKQVDDLAGKVAETKVATEDAEGETASKQEP